MAPAQIALRDIHQATAPAWWPPAPGWWVVAALVVAIVAAAWILRRRKIRHAHQFHVVASDDRVQGPLADVAGGPLDDAEWSVVGHEGLLAGAVRFR